MQTHLFERFPRHVSLTAQGELFLLHANEILQAKDAACNAMKTQTQLTGTLRIGMIESICSSIFPVICQLFHERYPGVSLRIETASIDQLLDYMNHNQVDLVYLMDQQLQDGAWIKVLEYPSDVLFVARYDHPLCQKKAITLADILSEKLMLTEQDASYRYALQQQAARMGLTVKPFLEIGNTAFLVDMVKQGLAISFLPRFSVEEELQKIQGKVEFYYHEILSLLKSEYDINCSIRKYLLPSLYQEGLLCKNKQDVYKELEKLLAAMWGEAEAAKLVNGIYHLGNEVGNDIICLHSRYDYHTPFIAFLSLKNHMLWEKQHVRYIFFMNMNVESDKEMVHHMYHLISNWADVKTRITYYAKNQDYQELIESLDNSRL